MSYRDVDGNEVDGNGRPIESREVSMTDDLMMKALRASEHQVYHAAADTIERLTAQLRGKEPYE